MASEHKTPNIPWIVILAFLLLALGIGLTGYHHYSNHREELREKKAAELTAIVALKVDTIPRALEEGAFGRR